MIRNWAALEIFQHARPENVQSEKNHDLLNLSDDATISIMLKYFIKKPFNNLPV